MTREERADVVVVGAGAFGALIAWQLQAAGVPDVLIVERDEVAQGTSSAGAGFVGLWAGGKPAGWEDELRVERYGVGFYRALAARRDTFDFEANGILWLALSESGWDEHLRVRAAHPGVPESRTVDGDEAERLTSRMVDGAKVYRAIYEPVGAQLTARNAVAAVTAEYLSGGGRLQERRPVTGLRPAGGRIAGVDTDRGPIAADHVILACGAWTNALLAGVGAFAPMVTLMTSRLVSDDVGAPRGIPAMLVPELSGLWLRQGSGRLVWGGAYDVAPRGLLATASDAPARLDQLPLDGLMAERELGRRASALVPLLSSCTSVTGAYGAPTYTADGLALVGRVGELDGLYMAGGCNEAGITHGPGYARLIADLVTGRSPDVDPATYAPGRFAGSLVTPEDVLRARAAA